MTEIKTLDEIKKDIAISCSEEHFDVIFEAEIGVGDLETARNLYIKAIDTYINQFK